MGTIIASYFILISLIILYNKWIWKIDLKI
jgi:hypothetical protein